MDLETAIVRMSADESWLTFVGYVKTERESCLSDFQNLEMVEKPQSLAYLAGEIAALDRLLKVVDEVEGVNSAASLE